MKKLAIILSIVLALLIAGVVLYFTSSTVRSWLPVGSSAAEPTTQTSTPEEPTTPEATTAPHPLAIALMNFRAQAQARFDEIAAEDPPSGRWQMRLSAYAAFSIDDGFVAFANIYHTEDGNIYSQDQFVEQWHAHYVYENGRAVEGPLLETGFAEDPDLTDEILAMRIDIPAGAEPPAYYRAAVQRGTSLRIRGGPGLDYPQLGNIPAGGVVQVSEQRNGWGRVTYAMRVPSDATRLSLREVTGWASMEFLQRID